MPNTLNVEFDQDATVALDRIAAILALPRTDVIRHALALYDFVVRERLQGRTLYVHDPQTDAKRKLIVRGIPDLPQQA